MKYDVDFFIQKFEAIPEKNWCCGRLHYEDASCSLGHCGVMPAKENNGNNDGYTWDYQYTEEGTALMKMFSDFFKINKHSDQTAIVTVINDGGKCAINAKYYQETPKERILAVLYDIKKMQQPEIPQPPKQIIRYIKVDDHIQNQVKEILESEIQN